VWNLDLCDLSYWLLGEWDLTLCDVIHFAGCLGSDFVDNEITQTFEFLARLWNASNGFLTILSNCMTRRYALFLIFCPQLRVPRKPLWTG